MSDPNTEIEEEIIEKTEVEVDDKDVDPRLSKAVEILIKSTGINKDKLKGKTMPEQFDLLTFYMENMPEKNKKTPNKNEPIIPLPSGTVASIGRKVKDSTGNFYLFKPQEWIPQKKNKN